MKCVKSVISVEFQISSGTHLRNTKKSLRLSRVLASGPGRLDLHKKIEEVQNSKKKYAAPTENTKDILSFLFSWRFSPFRLQCEKPWYSYRIIEVSAVPFPAKSSFAWKSWFPVKITDFHENRRISPETAIFTKMLVSQKGAPRKHQETVTFIKGSGAGGGGSWIFAETWQSWKSGENGRKTQKSWNSAKNARKRETAETGKPRIPGNRGPPARPPLADRRISKPRVAQLTFIKIRHAFVAKRPKCAPFSIQILDKRQVL